MPRRSLPVNIVLELSAVASRPAPRSIRLAAPRLASEAARVADLGCGYMQGTLELLKHHEQVYAVDSERQRNRIAGPLTECEGHPGFVGFRPWETFRDSRLRLGGVYVVNVLHTLPSPELRVELLLAARQNLRQDGFVLVDVPYYEHYYDGRMSEANAYGDGYLFKRGGVSATFYRFSTPAEMDGWATDAGLAFDFRIVDNHHYVRIYRLA